MIGAVAVAVYTAPAMGTPTTGTVAPAAGALVAFDGTVTVSSEPTGSGGHGSITNTGTWTASGAVTGSFAVSELTWFGGNTVHDVFTLAGGAGTITIDVHATFVGFAAAYEYVKGSWTVTAGTGAYANLHGQGDYAATVDKSTRRFIVTESLTGFGNYVPTS